MTFVIDITAPQTRQFTSSTGEKVLISLAFGTWWWVDTVVGIANYVEDDMVWLN